MDLVVGVVVLIDLCIDVVFDLDLRFGEVAEGDSAVEGVFEWAIRSDLICAESLFNFFVTESVQPLVKLLGRHCGCR